MKKFIGLPISSAPTDGGKPDLAKAGKDIYEALTGTGNYGYKKQVRNQMVKVEPERNYSPSEVAAILNISYDAASRAMLKMKGVVDLGTPTRRYKRGKKKLRINGKNLLLFLRSKTMD